MKGYYEDFYALRRRKNKPNSKPIKANLRIMKQFDVKKTEFALPRQTFYVRLAV